MDRKLIRETLAAAVIFLSAILARETGRAFPTVSQARETLRAEFSTCGKFGPIVFSLGFDRFPRFPSVSRVFPGNAHRVFPAPSPSVGGEGSTRFLAQFLEAFFSGNARPGFSGDVDALQKPGAYSVNLVEETHRHTVEGSDPRRIQRRRRVPRARAQSVRGEQPGPPSRDQRSARANEGSIPRADRGRRSRAWIEAETRADRGSPDLRGSQCPDYRGEIFLRSLLRKSEGVSRRLPSFPGDRRSERTHGRARLAGPRRDEPSSSREE